MKPEITYQEAKKLFSQDYERLFEEARDLAEKRVTFYKNAFVPISITGLRCELNCKHCQRHYLRHMLKAETQEKFIEVCKKLDEKGIPGIVLSGGSTKQGVVPLHRFVEAIRRVKEETSLTILAHTGVVNERQAKLLGEAGLDAALIDVVGSERTTKEVFGINLSPKKYIEALKAIDKSKIKKVSPHIIVGLHFGKIVGELKALSMLSSSRLDNIVIVVLIPTEGTAMQGISPPSPIEIGKIIAIAKIMYPSIDVALGCVRPGKIYREAIDEFALKAGATKLAVPSSKARLVARELGLKIKEYEQMCCGWI